MPRCHSSTEFVLRMSREEIGNLLGLTLETVSRLFPRFAREGLIKINQREARILTCPPWLRLRERRTLLLLRARTFLAWRKPAPRARPVASAGRGVGADRYTGRAAGSLGRACPDPTGSPYDYDELNPRPSAPCSPAVAKP